MTVTVRMQTNGNRSGFDLREVLGYFWRENRTMAVFFWTSLVVLVVSVIGMAIDPRTVLGQSSWAKSTKFMLSFIAYVPTMYWLYAHVNIRPQLKAFVMHSTAGILLLETALLVLQAARGVPMHFNVSTDFNAMLWSVMSITIMIFYVLSIIGGALIVMQQMRDRVYGDALRWGVALMLLGFGLGFLMTGPTPEQLEALEDGQTVPMMGAHTVGAADGGAGLPLLGWSTEHGDLRVSHFVGIHGAQVMLIVGWLVTMLGGRIGLARWRQLALVWGAGVGYASLTLAVAWQGLRGESVIAPSGLTLGVFGALTVAVMVYYAAVLMTARRERVVLAS